MNVSSPLRRPWPSLVTLVVALWLGSLAHTLLSVATLFREFPKATSDVAVNAAPALFAATEKLHLGLAIVGVVAAMLWRRVACNRARRWISYSLVAATVLAVVQAAIVSPRMETLRLAGEGGGDAFKQLHVASSVQYLAQTACLLVATLLLPGALRDGDTCDMPHA